MTSKPLARTRLQSNYVYIRNEQYNIKTKSYLERYSPKFPTVTHFLKFSRLSCEACPLNP